MGWNQTNTFYAETGILPFGPTLAGKYDDPNEQKQAWCFKEARGSTFHDLFLN
jgi:hypothetical protein